MSDDDCANKKEFQHREGGFLAWLVVLACAFNLGVNYGFVNVYSLIYNEFVVYYDEVNEHAVSYAAGIGALSNSLKFLLYGFSLVLVNVFGARAIGAAGGLIGTAALIGSAFVKTLALHFVTYGVLLAIGQAFQFAAVLAIIPHYFKIRLGRATCVLKIVATVLTTTLPIVVSECLYSLGLSNMFFILSCFSFASLLLATTYQPQLPKSSEETVTRALNAGLNFDIFRRRKFLLWIFCSFVGFFGFLIPNITICHYASIILPDSNPAILVLILGLASGILGILFAVVNGMATLSPMNFHILGFIMVGVAQILLVYVKSFPVLCVLAAIFGIADSLFLSFIVACSCEVTNSYSFASQASAYLFAFVAIPTLFGPSMAGYLFEKNGSYAVSYYVGGATCLFAGVFLLIFYPETILRDFIKMVQCRRAKVKKVPKDEVQFDNTREAERVQDYY